MPEAQPDMFDEAAANEAGDEAVERVGKNADPKWIARALDAVKRVASESPVFTTDDVWRILLRFDAEPRERRAMGHVMKKAAELGYCSKSSEYRPSVRKKCHGRPVRVWVSELPGPHPVSSMVTKGGA